MALNLRLFPSQRPAGARRAAVPRHAVPQLPTADWVSCCLCLLSADLSFSIYITTLTVCHFALL